MLVKRPLYPVGKEEELLCIDFVVPLRSTATCEPKPCQKMPPQQNVRFLAFTTQVAGCLR